jgi:hypothetical protein
MGFKYVKLFCNHSVFSLGIRVKAKAEQTQYVNFGRRTLFIFRELNLELIDEQNNCLIDYKITMKL